MSQLTEDIVASMAPTDGAMGDARGLLKKGALQKLSRSDDGKLVFAECKGSAKLPYAVSLDFAAGGERPTVRCNCPSRQRPCKHGLALALTFVSKAASFKVAEPPADLVEKSDKLKTQREKSPAAAEKPRVVNQTALAKKAEQQRDALVSLDRFVIDLVTTGLGGVKAKGVSALRDQASRMGDSQLYGARARLLQLAALLESDEDEDDDDEDDEDRVRTKPALTEEARLARLTTDVVQLWVAVRKGQHMLEGKTEEGESRSEGDAQLESLLGRAWRLPELKEAGYWVTDRQLLELAHEHREDRTLEMVSAAGYLLDLGDGSVHVETTALPVAAARRPDAHLRPSRRGVVQVREAALYPGETVNRRIRWSEREADGAATERSVEKADLDKLHTLARPLDAALKALREQLKNPLAPSEAVVLIKAARFGQATRNGAPVTVLEDAAGQRLVLRDPPEQAYATTLNLTHAAAAYGPGSVATRLWYDPLERAIFGQALALFVGEKHLRLGL